MQLLSMVKYTLQARLAELLLAACMLLLTSVWLVFESHLATLAPAIPHKWALRSMVGLSILVVLNIATFFYFRPKFKFDELAGTWIDRKTDLRYCSKCKSTKILSPLKNRDRGWDCPVCYAYFSDPARKEPEPPRQNLGPTAWMAQ